MVTVTKSTPDISMVPDTAAKDAKIVEAAVEPIPKRKFYLLSHKTVVLLPCYWNSNSLMFFVFCFGIFLRFAFLQNNIFVKRAEESALKSFLSGGFGGVCIVLVGHPLDLVKVSQNPTFALLII